MQLKEFTRSVRVKWLFRWQAKLSSQYVRIRFTTVVSSPPDHCDYPSESQSCVYQIL